MKQDNIYQLENQPKSVVEDPLTEILRKGAHQLIEQALEAELEHLLEAMRLLKDEQDRRRVVRNGHLPERDVQTASDQ